MTTPILMYHAVLADADHPEGSDPVYAVTAATFAEHLKLIATADKAGSCLRDLLVGAPDPEPLNTVILSFDDGHLSNYARALPLLLEAEMTADFYINSDTVGSGHFCSWAQLREMHEAGMSIQSHGHTHAYFDELSEDQIRHQLRTSKDRIEQHIGAPVTLFAPPGGRLRAEVGAIAVELGYRAICGSQPGYWGGDAPRAKRALPRLAVQLGTPETQMARWIAGDRVSVAKQQLRYGALKGAKMLFGNERYEKLRGKMLKQDIDEIETTQKR